MAKLVLFNKPFLVLSQFTDTEGRETLAKYIQDKSLHVCGRLDYDSEGLLLLTDSGPLKHLISHPNSRKLKTYWVQVEGTPTEKSLQDLREGIRLKDGITLPAKVKWIPPPALWDRHPPIRERKNIPTSWLELSITEGRNRQVRRMTAAVGLPTLRLVRSRIDNWELGNLAPGEMAYLELNVPEALPKSAKQKASRSKSVAAQRQTKGDTGFSNHQHAHRKRIKR